MIIDSFTFFNEYDMLEGRLEYLYNHVDYFLIVEANLSFSGKVKPFNYLNQIRRFQKYTDKILYFPIDIPREDYEWVTYEGRHPTRSDSEWQVEFRQRNHIGHALKIFRDEDYVLVGDIDEIPNRDKIGLAIEALNRSAAVSMAQKVFVYNLDREQFGTWYGTVVTKCGIVSGLSAQHCRDSRFHAMPHIENGGWHFTYWGGIENIQTKLANFAHQEANTPIFTNSDLIAKRMSLGLHPLEPIELVIGQKDSTSVPAKHTLPKDVIDIFEKYVKQM